MPCMKGAGRRHLAINHETPLRSVVIPCNAIDTCFCYWIVARSAVCSLPWIPWYESNVFDMPCYRYGFKSPPKLTLVAKPRLGNREVKLSRVTHWIERKLQELVNVSYVAPSSSLQ